MVITIHSEHSIAVLIGDCQKLFLHFFSQDSFIIANDSYRVCPDTLVPKKQRGDGVHMIICLILRIDRPTWHVLYAIKDAKILVHFAILVVMNPLI